MTILSRTGHNLLRVAQHNELLLAFVLTFAYFELFFSLNPQLSLEDTLSLISFAFDQCLRFTS